MSFRFYATRFLPFSILFVAMFIGGCAVSIPGVGDSKWKLIDNQGTITTPPKTSFESLASEDFAMFDESGLPAFQEKVCRVRVDHHCGYVDEKGQFVIKPQFVNAGQFHDGLACIADEANHLGYIDHSGAFVIPAKFGHDERYPNGMERMEFHDGLAAAMTGGKFGYIDKTGKWVIKPAFLDCLPFSGGIAEVSKMKSEHKVVTECFDRTGKVVGSINVDRDYFLHAPYKSAFGEDGLALCLAPKSVDGKFEVFCDKGGAQKLGPFWRAEPFSEGLAAVADKPIGRCLYGYIDTNGAIVIPAKFTTAAQFKDGMACVSVPGAGAALKFGFIDKTGKVVIEPSFDSANDFSNGLAQVWHGDKCGYVDKTGKEVVAVKYSDGKAFSDGMSAVQQSVGLNISIIAMRHLSGYPQSFSLNKYPNAIVETASNGSIGLPNGRKQTQLMLLSRDSLDDIEKFYADEMHVLGYEPRTMEELDKKNVKLKVTSSGVKDPFSKEHYRFMAAPSRINLRGKWPVTFGKSGKLQTKIS